MPGPKNATVGQSQLINTTDQSAGNVTGGTQAANQSINSRSVPETTTIAPQHTTIASSQKNNETDEGPLLSDRETPKLANKAEVPADGGGIINRGNYTSATQDPMSNPYVYNPNQPLGIKNTDGAHMTQESKRYLKKTRCLDILFHSTPRPCLIYESFSVLRVHKAKPPGWSVG